MFAPSAPQNPRLRAPVTLFFMHSIHDLPNHLGETVRVAGWLTGLRSSGKIAFLQLRDGTGFVQGVIAKADVAEEILSAPDGWAKKRALW